MTNYMCFTPLIMDFCLIFLFGRHNFRNITTVNKIKKFVTYKVFV